MMWGLERRQGLGELHFVTCSCYRRMGYLNTPAARDLFEDALQKVQVRYGFDVVGYVVMPEHVRLLVSERGAGVVVSGATGVGISIAFSTVGFWSRLY